MDESDSIYDIKTFPHARRHNEDLLNTYQLGILLSYSNIRDRIQLQFIS